MKKSLIALAVLASAGAASAQSSVTLFGVVDTAITYSRAANASKTALTGGGYNSNRLGFRGTEDLGGGMSASFWLEAGYNSDNGTGSGTNTNNQVSGGATAAAGTQGLTFNRRATVSLAGGWGEVRLGRDYTPQFWNRTVFDPFGTVGVGASQADASALGGPVSVRASNSVGYFLPGNLGGFYGQYQHYLGENNSNSVVTGTTIGNKNDGVGDGVRVGYANGPANAAIAYANTRYATGNIKNFNLGGQWDFGVAKLMGEYQRDRVSSTPSVTGKGYLIGGLVPVGPGEIRLAYSQYKTDALGGPKTKKVSVGYVHNLSKRTALYTTYANVRNSGGATAALNGQTANPGGKAGGFDFGVRHSF